MPVPIPLLERYRDLLARPEEDFPLTLGEGGTPLIRARRLGAEIGLDQLWLKFEGTNPTGSFKDRGMVLAVTRALATGARAVVCASTGNTSASAAAYAAAAGLTCYVVLPAGKVARGKLAQALAGGAQLISIEGNFDEALEAVRRLGEEGVAAVVNSVNPDRIEGQQTAAWEIVDALGSAPDALALPVGNAGNITAYWRGFSRYCADGRAATRPRMLGFQAAGAAPLVHGERVAKPETVASAIRIGNPARWEEAMAAMTSSRGAVRAVSDAEILEAYDFLARREGIFCEPASAASVAGLIKYGPDGCARIACVLTGNGLKDPQTALDRAGGVIPCAAERAPLEAAVLR
jgi:threonine synthase